MREIERKRKRKRERKREREKDKRDREIVSERQTDEKLAQYDKNLLTFAVTSYSVSCTLCLASQLYTATPLPP